MGLRKNRCNVLTVSEALDDTLRAPLLKIIRTNTGRIARIEISHQLETYFKPTLPKQTRRLDKLKDAFITQ
ncbi:hypothetical protein SAMN05216603_106207 [Pseudomonas benzenivorans]|nr:hypothetical protein SAMN05216603_106207 [Pseudomonas benzenivorans]